MKCMATAVVLVLLLYSPSLSQPCTNSLTLECPPASLNGTVYISVRVTNCSSTIDSLEFDVYFFDLDVQFYGVDRAGTMLEDWTYVYGGIVWPGGGRVTAFDLGDGFGPVTDALLIKLRFEVLTYLSKHTSIWIVNPHGDLTGFEVQNCLLPVPTAPSTWGHIKSLYE